MVVGRWWGLIGRRTIRLDQIMSLSLERVILKQTYEELSPGGSDARSWSIRGRRTLTACPLDGQDTG